MPSIQDPNTPEVLFHFARELGVNVEQNRVDIPQTLGSGYCLAYKFNPKIRMLILNYRLFQDIVLTDPDKDIQSKMLLFKFQHIFPDAEKKENELPSVLIATRQVESDVLMPIHTHTATINIEVDAGYLKSLFPAANASTVLTSLLENDQPLLFEQAVSPSMLQVVNEIITTPVTETFRLFFLRIKSEELVCRLLIELEKRKEKQLYPINQRDIQHLYNIREKILEHLDTPPTLIDLATLGNMSTSKLKILFKQIFGKSIYSYYQQFRMHEAARMLQKGKLTVSEVGYQLGFSNLSHFSRVFEQHIGQKPKKFSMQQ